MSQTLAMWNYSQIYLKFAFKLYLCKIPNESPTAFFTLSFPGFKIFSLKVSNALKGILNRYRRPPSTKSQVSETVMLSHFQHGNHSASLDEHPEVSSHGGNYLKSKRRWNPAKIFQEETNHASTTSPSLKRGQVVSGWEFSPLKATSSAAACGAVSGSLSQAERSLTPSLGLHLEKLKWVPAHEVSWDQRQKLQPFSNPSCCLWPHPPPASLSPWLSQSDPFQGDAIVTGTIPAPQPLGLVNGLSARADTQGGVYEAFTSPLLLWGLALETGSQPPHDAFYAPRGSHETVFQPDTSRDVVLGGVLALKGAKCKHLGSIYLLLINRAGSQGVTLGPPNWRYLSWS